MVAVSQRLRHIIDRHHRLGRLLLGCGIASSVLYVATDVVASLRYDGYRYSEQQISELFAAGAPSRGFMVAANLIPYNVLLVAFAAGVWISAGQRRPARITAAMLVAFAFFGAVGGGIFNMDRREVIAAGEATLRNDLHPAATGVMSLFIVLSMVFGSRVLGRRFRHYSYATIATLIVFGILTSLQVGKLAADEPTPWMGIWERVNIYATMLWMAALALGLLQSQRPTVTGQLETRALTPQRIQGAPQ